MTEEIVRRRSPSTSDTKGKEFDPSELNADLGQVAIAKELIKKLPTPAIDTRKFTIIHGLMKSMNHSENNKTYIDTSLLVDLMDRVSEKSVNVDGWYIKSLFTYLNKPKVIIQGMGFTPTEEKKPGFLSRMWAGITGKEQPQEGAQQ